MSVQADLIQLPSADEIYQRLTSHGYGQFAQSTALHTTLGGKKATPLWVAMMVERATYDFMKQYPGQIHNAEQASTEIMDIIIIE